ANPERWSGPTCNWVTTPVLRHICLFAAPEGALCQPNRGNFLPIVEPMCLPEGFMTQLKPEGQHHDRVDERATVATGKRRVPGDGRSEPGESRPWLPPGVFRYGNPNNLSVVFCKWHARAISHNRRLARRSGCYAQRARLS